LPFSLFTESQIQLGGGLRVSIIGAVIMGVAVVVLAALWYLLERSRWGRQVRTLAYDRELAGMLGINVDLITVTVFGLAGALAGLAAILYGVAFYQVSYNMGDSYGLVALAVVVIGGVGSVMGTYVIGVGAGICSTLVVAYWNTNYRDIILFSLMVAILRVRPQGLFGGRLDRVRA
jgi:branched-chain amino acid transport system permease protein